MVGCLPRPLYLLVLQCRCDSPALMVSHRSRAVIMSSLILLCVVVLSLPNVPEKFLGIRSPEQVMNSFSMPQNNAPGNSIEGSQFPHHADTKPHPMNRRHVPHKFWARARPHNKFKGKKSKLHGNIHNEGMMKSRNTSAISK